MSGDAVLVACGDEVAEERVRLQRLGFEFGVELAAEEEGVRGDFDDLDVGGVGRGAGEAEACAGEDGFVLAVELVAVTVALADFCFAVGVGGEGVGLHDAVPGSEAHGATHLFNSGELAEFVDDAVRGGGVELAGVGVLEAAYIAGVLDAGGLHAETDAEVGDCLFAGVADGVEHTFDAALAEAAGYEDAVEALKLSGVVGDFEAFGFEPGDAELEVVGERAVDESFLEGFVGVFVLDVLADDGDGDFVFGVIGAANDVLPLGEVGSLGVDAEVLEGEGVYAFGGEGERDLVDAGDIAGGDDGGLFHVAEEGDLVAHLAGNSAVGAAEQDVWLDTDGEHLLDGVLGGFGFKFLRGGDPGDEGDMDEAGIFAAEVLTHLADGFEEGQRFDIADGTTNLYDGDVAVGSDLAHGVLDFVGDVRDDLNGLAEIVAAALLGDDLLVDAAGSEVVVTCQLGVGEALVVTEVEVGLGAVVGDEDLAVLEGRHGAGVDVEIGIKLHEIDLDSAGFEEAADGGGGETFAKGRHDSASYEDVLCRHVRDLFVCI